MWKVPKGYRIWSSVHELISAIMPPSLFRGVHEDTLDERRPPWDCGRLSASVGFGGGHQTHDKDNEFFENPNLRLNPCMSPDLYQPSMRSRRFAYPSLDFMWALSGLPTAPHSDFVSLSRHCVDFRRPCLNSLGICLGPPQAF